MDPTKTNSLYYALAFLHPALMAVSLVLAGLALRLGLQMRTARQRRTKRPREGRSRHLRLAKVALWLGLVGFLAGPASMAWLRDKPTMETLHAKTALAAAALAVAVAWMGRRLEDGRSKAFGGHGGLGLLAAMLGLVAAVTGIELLP